MDLIQNVLFLVLGAALGWLTNYFFYEKAEKKAWLAAYPLEERTDDILSMLLRNRLEARWGSSFAENIEATELPEDTDVPHVMHYQITSLHPKQGETVGIFFRIVDSGMNFDGYVQVTEVSSQVRMPAVREGHGYYSCQVTFPRNMVLGLYKVEFRLTDLVGKQSCQFLEFDVVSQ